VRAVIQRVSRASVEVDGKPVSEIEAGLLVLLGVETDDGPEDLEYLVQKTLNLRIFEDLEGKFNRSLLDAGGEILVVSQFTLYGDCRKGRRPSFTRAAPPEIAEPAYERFAARAREMGVTARTGVFGAMMDVSLVNRGPVTMLLDSKKEF